MNPQDFLKKYLAIPAYRFCQKCLSRDGISNSLQKISNFIYDRSSDPSFMMIFFTSLSIISSHLAQLNGLRKSKRENKDYLMQQERIELGLDVVLSVLPTFAINRFLSKKLDSGVWSTTSSRLKMINEIPEVVGTDENDIYDISHIVPIKEKIIDGYNSFKIFLSKNKYLPESFRSKININPIDNNKIMPAPKFVPILLEYDDEMKGQAKNMRNGKALDDLGNSRNGMLVMATLGYTILATNIIMPIIKNFLTNWRYKKELAEKGETPESIKRKKRFEFNKNTLRNSTFDDFSNKINSMSSVKNNNVNAIKTNTQYTSRMPRNSVFYDISTRSSSLKI